MPFLPSNQQRQSTEWKLTSELSENKSSDRKLSLIPFMSSAFCQIAISKVLGTFDPLNQDWYQRHCSETFLQAWMISRA